jgi:hypothetical protein
MELDKMLKELVPIEVMFIHTAYKAQSDKYLVLDGKVQYKGNELEPIEVLELYKNENKNSKIIMSEICKRFINDDNTYRWETKNRII